MNQQKYYIEQIINQVEEEEQFNRNDAYIFKLKCGIVCSVCVLLIIAFLLIRLHYKQTQLVRSIKYNQSRITPSLSNFRNFFDTNIKPTFSLFINSYNTNLETRQRFRISRSESISQAETAFIRKIFDSLMNIQSTQIFENLMINGNESSYTIDKKNIYMCLTNYFNNSPANLDVVVFVFLHECSHIACEDADHSYEFWCIFRFILDVFCNFEGRIFKDLQLCSLNMEEHPIKYCKNMLITYNPLFDSNTYLTFNSLQQSSY